MSKGNPSYLSPPGFNYIKGSKRKVSAAGAHDPHYQVTSFRDINFESEEMKRLLNMGIPDFIEKKGPEIKYDSNALMPDWIINNPDWKRTRCDNNDNNLISDILQIPFSGRSQEQCTVLSKWLMSVWEIANTMGFKRCISMSEAMQYSVFEPGKHIVKEGDRGLVFYIIVSGTSNVHKEGIGNVAQLTKGQSFGELALTQGKDLRTASVIAFTRTEVLCLHKRDYDHFVRDIQLGERRENFAAIRQCKLFEHWTRNKIERMCNTARRETYKEGQYIFRQGDQPDNLYLVVEGVLHAVRDIETMITNRWPTGKNSWETISKKHKKSVLVKELTKGDYFGELSIIKNDVRRANVVAKTRCVLLTIDKLDFLHLLRHRNAIKSVLDSAEEYAEVNKIMDNNKDSADDASVESCTSNTGRRLSLKFKKAVAKAVDNENINSGKKKYNFAMAARDVPQKSRPATLSPKPMSRMGTISNMTSSKTRLVKHDENETVKLFREQLGNIEYDSSPMPSPRHAQRLSNNADRPSTVIDTELNTSWRKQSAFGMNFPKSISFNRHKETRPKTTEGGMMSPEKPENEGSASSAALVVFSPITELSVINEQKAKNKVLMHVNSSDKPLNVSVTATLEVNSRGRRQQSVCVQGIKELVNKTQQIWAHEAATSPTSTGSNFRRQSSLGLLNTCTDEYNPSTKTESELQSPGDHSTNVPIKPNQFTQQQLIGLQRKMSSFTDQQEDVTRDEVTGELLFKKLRKVPQEFQKPIIDRAKLTFYEIMSKNVHNELSESNDNLPSIVVPPAGDHKLLFSAAGNRRSMIARPSSSPTARRQSKY